MTGHRLRTVSTHAASCLRYSTLQIPSTLITNNEVPNLNPKKKMDGGCLPRTRRVLAGAGAGIGGGEGGDAGEVAGGANRAVLLVVAVGGIGAVRHDGVGVVARSVLHDLGAVGAAPARVVDRLLHRTGALVGLAHTERPICWGFQR